MFIHTQTSEQFKQHVTLCIVLWVQKTVPENGVNK